MSKGRIVAAGVVGGVVMFIWGAAAHMALPLGEMGVKSLPGEQMIMPALRFSIQERGLYRFPLMDKNDTSGSARKSYDEKYKAGPRGMLAFDPAGGEQMPQLVAELGSDFLAAILLAIVLARVRGGIATRTIFGAMLGLSAWATIDLSYWNWFRFPGEFTIAQGIDQGVNGLLAGLVIALVYGFGRATRTQPA